MASCHVIISRFLRRLSRQTVTPTNDPRGWDFGPYRMRAPNFKARNGKSHNNQKTEGAS